MYLSLFIYSNDNKHMIFHIEFSRRYSNIGRDKPLPQSSNTDELYSNTIYIYIYAKRF